MLWLADQCVIWLTQHWQEVSTGTATALIGAPLLLWLLPRLHPSSTPSVSQGDRIPGECHNLLFWSLCGILLLLLLGAAALSFGRDAYGWQ